MGDSSAKQGTVKTENIPGLALHVFWLMKFSYICATFFNFKRGKNPHLKVSFPLHLQTRLLQQNTGQFSKCVTQLQENKRIHEKQNSEFKQY